MSNSIIRFVRLGAGRRRTRWVLLGSVAILVVLPIGWLGHALAQRSEPAAKPPPAGMPGIYQQAPLASYPVLVEEKLDFRANEQLNVRVRDVASKLQSVPEDDRPPELMAELKNLITEQFEARHQSQLRRVEKILEGAKITREQLARREEQKAAIIERRLKEIMGESDPLNWDYQPGGSTYAPKAARLRSGPASQGYGPGIPHSTPPHMHQVQPGGASLRSTAPRLPGLRSSTAPVAGFSAAEKSKLWPSKAASANDPFADSPNADQPNIPKPDDSPFAAGQPADPFGGPAFPKNRNEPWGVAPDPFGSNLDNSDPFSRPTRLDRATNPNAVISTAYRLQEIQNESQNSQKLFEKGAITRSRIQQIQSAWDEARSIWEFQKRSLQGRIEIATLAVEAARANLESVVREMKANVAEKRVYEARKELSIAEVELRGLVELLEWMTKFEKESLKETLNMGEAEVDDSTDSLGNQDLSEERTSLEQLIQRYGPGHPKVIAAESLENPSAAEDQKIEAEVQEDAAEEVKPNSGVGSTSNRRR